MQKNATSRGKVDIYITQDIRTSDIGEISVDLELASKYIEALRSLRDAFSLRDDISVMSVARNQEIFKSVHEEADTDEDWQIISSALTEAIAGYLAMRESEGERIRTDITAKLERIRELSAEVEKISSELRVYDFTADYKTGLVYVLQWWYAAGFYAGYSFILFT